jgi:transposase
MSQLSEKQKYEIIFRHENNESSRQISKSMKIARSTVIRWIKKYADDKNIYRKNGSGRKRKTTKKEDLSIVDKTKKEHITLNEIRNEIKNENINLSRETIRKRLHENNKIYCVPIKKPLLTEKHREMRLNWAFNNINTNWYKVLFSDEASIWKYTYGKKQWMDKNNKLVERTVKYPEKINIWGFISIHGIGSVNIFDKNMDAIKYIDILKNSLMPYYTNNFLFMSDNDPKHTSKIAKKFIEENNINCIKFPSCSPDLNPIENCWNILKARLSNIKINTKEELIQHTKTIWNEIEYTTIFNLINSMQIRVIKVIENNGDTINY